jgi:hypothetical protein
MRHLMAYIYMIGWKGGFLFPSAKELAIPPTDGVYKTCISADELRTEVAAILTNAEAMVQQGSNGNGKRHCTEFPRPGNN